MRSIQLAIILLAAFAFAGCAKKPHGKYVARVEIGGTFVELSYDFREDGFATAWITTNGAAVAAQGRWRMENDAVRFDGVSVDPKTKEQKQISHVLHFDGDDLFRDDLTVRFVRQR